MKIFNEAAQLVCFFFSNIRAFNSSTYKTMKKLFRMNESCYTGFTADVSVTRILE